MFWVVVIIFRKEVTHSGRKERLQVEGRNWKQVHWEFLGRLRSSRGGVMDEGTGGGREDASIGGLAGLLEPATMTRFGMNVGRFRSLSFLFPLSSAKKTRDNVKAPRAINLSSARIIKIIGR